MNQARGDHLVMIEKDKLCTLPFRTFREGVFGKNLEAALHKLLEEFPDIIPGTQIDPNSEDPPIFVLLKHEIGAGPGSLDFILTDQYGIPTLIEAKLFENQESKREVIGQILEYAANAVQEWGDGRLRGQAAEYWGKKGQQLDGILSDRFGEDVDVENLWSQIEENLSQKKLRLIIAADKLRPEVRRIIEFLNSETENVEILGMEITCYERDTNAIVLVPHIIGQSQVNIQKKSKQRWQGNIEDHFNNLEPPLGQNLKNLIAELGIEPSNVTGSGFHLSNKNRKIMISVWVRSKIEFRFSKASKNDIAQLLKSLHIDSLTVKDKSDIESHGLEHPTPAIDYKEAMGPFDNIIKLCKTWLMV